MLDQDRPGPPPPAAPDLEEDRRSRLERLRNLALLLQATGASVEVQVGALAREGLGPDAALDLLMGLLPDRTARMGALADFCFRVDDHLPRFRRLLERHGVCPLNFIFARERDPRAKRLLLERMGLNFEYGAWVGEDMGLHLDFRSDPDLRTLPEGLQVDLDLRLENCPNLVGLPPGLAVRTVRIRGCGRVEGLPGDLQCAGLQVVDCPALSLLPDGLEIGGSLVLEGLPALRRLPTGLTVRGDLRIGNCPGLEGLEWDLQVGGYLLLEDCPGLASLGGRICGPTKVKGCPALEEPPGSHPAIDGWRIHPWLPPWT